MIQLCGCLGLSVETLDVFFSGQLAGRNHLQRDDTTKIHLSGFVDNSHSAARNFFDQFVVAKVVDSATNGGCAGISVRRNCCVAVHWRPPLCVN